MTLQHPPAPVPHPHNMGPLPTVATGLTDQDRRRIQDALDCSVSTNTQVMYASAWRSFQGLDLRFAIAHHIFYFKSLPHREWPYDLEESLT